MKLKKNVFYLFLIIGLASCKKEQKDIPPKTETKFGIYSVPKVSKKFERIFPSKGFTSEDFVPKDCKLYLEAKGDLNKDGLDDRALIIKVPDTMAFRPVLVLLGQKDKSFVLHKISYTAMEPEYGEYKDPTHYSEDMTLENGVLKILCYGYGPNSNLFSTYHYVNNELILTNIETYSVGAGAQEILEYDLVKGKLVERVINTMIDSMPETKTVFSKKIKKTVFEQSNPSAIIEKVFSETELKY